ncbi:MAG: hypothetical protein R2814_03700 [Flavobacteriaceae bacterium]
MGLMDPPKKCHITELPTSNIISSHDLAEYYVEFNNKNIIFRFPWNHKNTPWVESNKHVFKDLLLNGQFPENLYISSAIGFLINTDSLKEIEVLDNEILEGIIKDNQNS